MPAPLQDKTPPAYWKLQAQLDWSYRVKVLEYCQKHGISQNEVLRQAIDKLCEEKD